jgi:hypothetical protein
MTLTENLKLDIAVAPSSHSSDGTTGYYHNLEKFVGATYVFACGTAGLTTTITASVYQATDKNGTSGARLTATDTTVYATSNLTLVTVTPSISAGGTGATVTINGVEFTGISGAGTATTSSREFVGNTANISTTVTNIAGIVNDTDYGVPGVYASASSTTVTLRFAEPGDLTDIDTDYDGIVVTSSNTTDLTIAALQMGGMIDFPGKALSLTSSFTHVAMNISASASVEMSATIIRYTNRYPIKNIEPITKQG